MDIGCGDGRLLVAAALRGATCVGIEADPVFSSRAESRAAESGVSASIRIITGDASVVTDVSGVTVVFVYLVPTGLAVMADRLADAHRSGARIVSNMFAIPGLPVRERRLAKGCPVYLY